MESRQLALIVQRDGGEYPPLYGGVPPSVPTVTSRVAAQSVKRGSHEMRNAVLAALRAEPQTCEELEARLGLRHQTCGPRIRELVQLGLVEDSGGRRRTQSGREATVWRAAPEQP